MSKILYGVSGEGSGHSSRAREMIRFLIAQGHAVLGASYDRGYRDLSPDFDFIEIEGLHIASDQNRVSVVETFTHNLVRIPDGIASFRNFAKRVDAFAPDVAITDFEPMTAYLARRREIPLITIDNQHRMRSMNYPCPLHLKKDGLITETIVRLMVPHPDVSLVTTFYFGQVKNDRTFLFPPILRQEVLDVAPTEGEAILVYFTQGFGDFLDKLRTFSDERFLVYGMASPGGMASERGTEDEGRDGPFTYRPFSRDGFLQDLASSKAVISTAGFTLMTEALYLGKPLMALPMRGQFEQELNALLLDDLGYGMNGRSAGTDEIREFLRRIPQFRDRLADYPRQGNSEIEQELAALLVDDAKKAWSFRSR